MSELFKGEEGVTTLGCRNDSNAVAREEGCGREAAGYCRGRGEYSYKTECNVSGVEVVTSILWEHWREEPWCHINKRGIVQLF